MGISLAEQAPPFKHPGHAPAGASPTPSPCSAPTQHEGDGVASEHARQPGEITVPVRAPGENLLVQLMLGWEREMPHEDGDAGGSTWTSMVPSPHVPTLCPSSSHAPQVAMSQKDLPRGLFFGCCPHQFCGASARKKAAGTAQVQVPRTPAAHVEPLHGACRARALLTMQQDQLLEGAHRCVLQHLLQLQGSRRQESPITSWFLHAHHTWPSLGP